MTQANRLPKAKDPNTYVNDLIEAEVERQVSIHREIDASLASGKPLETIGVEVLRFGTGTRVRYPTTIPKACNEALILTLNKSKISQRVNERLGYKIIHSIEDIVSMLESDADQVYASYGLPVGHKSYWLEHGAPEESWKQWHGGHPDPTHEWSQISHASILAKIADLGHDHPVSHAGRLHEAATLLEVTAKCTPLDLFHFANVAMDAQKKAQTLKDVVAVRVASGLTNAEAVHKGDKYFCDTSRGGRKYGEFNTEIGKINRGRVLKIALPLREANPGWSQATLSEVVTAEVAHGKQALTLKTVSKWIRDLTKSGELPSRSKKIPVC